MTVRAAALALALAACGGKQQPPAGGGSGSAEPAPLRDTRTEIQRRRDDACETVGKRLAQCAVEDSRALLAQGKITKQKLDEDTKPEFVRALAEDFRKDCRKGYMSSRQVRVLEVCLREETQCGPFESCLANLAPAAK